MATKEKETPTGERSIVSSRGKPRVYVLHFEIDVNVCAVRAETHIKAKIV